MRLRLCAKIPSERAITTEMEEAVFKTCWNSLLDVDGMVMIVGHPLQVWYVRTKEEELESSKLDSRRVVTMQRVAR